VTTAQNINQRLFAKFNETIVAGSCPCCFESRTQSVKVRNLCRLHYHVSWAAWISH